MQQFPDIIQVLPEPNPLIEAEDPCIRPKIPQIRRRNYYDESKVKANMWEYFTQQSKWLVYQKFDNYPWSMIPLNNCRFAAGCFFDCRKLLQLNKEIKLGEFQSILYKYLFPSTMKQKEYQKFVLEQNSRDYNGLKFDSSFECGNLHAAYRISNNEYDLMMNNDTNSKGHNQWFYFSVENTIRNQTVTFNIINFVKNDSQFNYGQKIVVYSNKKKVWMKAGINIVYFRNSIKRENSSNKTYYTLSFSYQFEYQNDKVYFAQCYPYTYTQLTSCLDKLLRYNNNNIKVKELCTTINKLPCPLVSIGNGSNIILLMARQHPGETPSSYAIEGVMEFLCGNTQEADALRNYFTFYIIPMMNPDGVVFGNYRCNMNGIDLNRIWSYPHKELHDTVWYVKDLIKSIVNDLNLVIDFHGHSRKMNGFFYGNNQSDEQKLLPLLASTISKMINYRDCAFNCPESKKSTARLSLQEEMKNGFTYTFEISFHAYKNIIPIDFTEHAYKQLGQDVLLAVYKYYERKFNKFSRLPKMISPQLNEELNNIIANIDLSKLDNNNVDDSGSDSNPEEDNLKIDEVQSIFETKKKSQMVMIQNRKKQSIKPLKIERSTQTDISHFQNLMLDEKVLASIEEQIKTFRKPDKHIQLSQIYLDENENTVACQTDISLQLILGRIQVYHMRISSKFDLPNSRDIYPQQQQTSNGKPLVIVLKNPYTMPTQVSQIKPYNPTQRRVSSNPRGRSALDQSRFNQRQFSIQGTPEKRSFLAANSPPNFKFKDATFEKIANISKLKFNKLKL